MLNISIKTKILIVFISLLGIVATSLLFLQFQFSKSIVVESTTKTFNIISNNIQEQLNNESLKIQNILKIKSEQKNILEPISFNKQHPSLGGLIQILQIYNNFNAIYFTHKDGGFYEVINIKNSPSISKVFDIPKNSLWMEIVIIDNIQQSSFLDKDLNILKKIKKDKKYFPHNRPWYLKALKSDKIISTKPYIFSTTNQMGITYAKRFKNGYGVIALDSTVKLLNNILHLQKFDEKSEIFLVNKDGKKIASSLYKDIDMINQQQTLEPIFLESVQKNGLGKVIRYEVEGIRYFALVTPISNANIYLGIKVDADILLEPYKKYVKYLIFIALGILFMSLPIILFSTNSIVKPIQDLILENEKVKIREFSEVKKIDTNILEFIELSHSLVSMSQSMQEYQKSQEKLLESIVKLIADAIDAKSPYTAGHCKRVPEIAKMLLDEANKIQTGVLKDFSLDGNDAIREFEIGSWLHDCGKVTTPEYVVDKATKLETIYDRIHEIRMRFEVLWRDAEIEFLKQKISFDEFTNKQDELQNEFRFIANTNIGGEFMDDEKIKRIKQISDRVWMRNFDDTLGLGELEKNRYKVSDILPVEERLLSDKNHHIIERKDFDYEDYKAQGFKEEVPKYLYNYGEIYNLCIKKGTLTKEERYKINEHVIMSIKMLEKIPFPSNFKNIPEYAGTHHETLDGRGYPRKLTKDQLSIPARIIAIADIFEALTASDRPYKRAKTLSSSIKIMSYMVKDKHIDKDLFELFLRSGVYKHYADGYLQENQIDEVNIDELLS